MPFTTDPTEAPIFRLPTAPDRENGLVQPSTLMVDKITTVPRANLGTRNGQLDPETMIIVDRAVLVFLGIG